MNLYKIAAAILLTVFLFPNNFVSANDGGPNGNLWIVSDSQTVCFSFDLSSLAKDEFIVYDYSPEVGIELGRPWTIVEEGKCYRYDNRDFVEAYVFKNSAKNIIEESIKKYNPKDNLDAGDTGLAYLFPEKYGYNPIKIEDIFNDKDIKPEYRIIYDFNFEGIGMMSLDKKILFGPELFPTTYYLGNGVSSGSSDITSGLIYGDSVVSEARNLWQGLTSDLSAVLEKCDTRKRVEYRHDISNYSRKIFWRISNNNDIYIGDRYKSVLTPVQQVVAMGCGEEYLQWLKENGNSFKQSDELALKIIERLSGDAVEFWQENRDWIIKNGFEDYYFEDGTGFSDSDIEYRVYRRDQKQLDELLTFANSENISENYSNIQVASSSGTLLEEPTSEKKIGSLMNSKNPFVRLYVILPIIALLGTISFLYLRNKRAL